MIKRKVCNCDDWKEFWPQIQNAQIMLNFRLVSYTGDLFRYCPWCGEALSDELEDELYDTMDEFIAVLDNSITT